MGGWGFPHYTRWVSQEKKMKFKKGGCFKIACIFAGRFFIALQGYIQIY
jgi:hypothetical protein